MRGYSEELDEQMCAHLRQLFALELGTQSLAELEGDEIFTRKQFAPMKRLLSTRDEDYIRSHGHGRNAAREMRRDHREAYSGYLKVLTDQVRRQRALRKLAMSGAGNWDVRSDMRKIFMCESALLYLRWLGWKRFFRISVDAGAVEDCLAVLVPEFGPISSAT